MIGLIFGGAIALHYGHKFLASAVSSGIQKASRNPYTGLPSSGSGCCCHGPSVFPLTPEQEAAVDRYSPEALQPLADKYWREHPNEVPRFFANDAEKRQFFANRAKERSDVPLDWEI
jgi:hypothetical protein